MSFVEQPVIYLSTVVCGSKFDESLVMLKSVSLLNRATVHAHIFAEDHLHVQFQEHLDAWPTEIKKRFLYTLHSIQYPPMIDSVDWINLFRPCASLRLFFVDILKDMDSTLYVDTDLLFLQPIDDIWSFHAKFNSTQILALAPEVEDGPVGSYHQITRHPYVPPEGVNSGVMLMNLTRMRKIGFLPHVISLHRKYRKSLYYGDQDLLNIYFYWFPEQLYQYSCAWNYRLDQCYHEINYCKAAGQSGVSVLHGNRNLFQIRNEPSFRAMYEAVRDYEHGESLEVLLEKMLSNLRNSSSIHCGRVSHLFTLQFSLHVKQAR